jgi:hypothetical protein
LSLSLEYFPRDKQQNICVCVCVYI